MKKEDKKQIIIQNNNLTGVQFDKSSLEVVALVARGLVNLTELFKTQNIHIDSLIDLSTKEDNKDE